MTDFANLADGGRRLGRMLAESEVDLSSAILLAALPNGVPVAIAVAEVTGLPIRAMPVLRTDEGASVPPLQDLDGRVAIVVDDGVETGTVAHAACAAIREARAARVVLAVPVCPREALVHLRPEYDDVVAVTMPMARRDLAWHYADFDTIDEAAAMRLLGAHRPIS